MTFEVYRDLVIKNIIFFGQLGLGLALFVASFMFLPWVFPAVLIASLALRCKRYRKLCRLIERNDAD